MMASDAGSYLDTVIGTGDVSNLCISIVMVPQSVKKLRFVKSAACITVTNLLTALCTGGRLFYYPFAGGVLDDIQLPSFKLVRAELASDDVFSAFCTAGRFHYAWFSGLMWQNFDFLCVQNDIAMFTTLNFQSGFIAGSYLGNFPVGR